MSNTYLAVGNKIRFYRKLNEFTQEELGEILDIDQSYLGRIERGEINITLETLIKIAGALHIDPSKLLEYSGKDSDDKKNEILNKIEFSISSLNTQELINFYSILEKIIEFKKS